METPGIKTERNILFEEKKCNAQLKSDGNSFAANSRNIQIIYFLIAELGNSKEGRRK